MGLRAFKTLIPFSLLALALAGFLFAGYSTTADAPGWLRMVVIEIQAACRDAGTQWMVVICLLSYLVVFLFLERRSLPQVSTKNAKQTTAPPTSDLRPLASIFARLVPFCGKNLDAWLIVFIALVLLRYAFDYSNAARSLQVVVLLTGIVVGKGIGLWVGRQKHSTFNAQLSTSKEIETTPHPVPLPERGGEGVEHREPAGLSTIHSQLSTNTRPSTINRAQLVLCVLILLLACAALWQPERGMEFQYRGQRRWTGVWDNPNTYGVLMGVGFTLAVGLLVSRLRSKDSSWVAKPEGEHSTLNIQHSTSNEVGRASPLPAAFADDTDGAHGVTRPTIHYAQCLLFLVAAGLCAYGLVKSFSRGAWLGTAVGIGYLMLRYMECGGTTPLWGTRHVASGKSCAESQQSKARWLPSSILIFSILVICFWQFRHTESPFFRRVFSVGNPNDFSWRNRVTAWQGAGLMILDKPIIGFGWGKAEEIYSKEYRAARLEESAAVQLNDYLMIGISAGVPALACLIAYLWLALSRRQVGRGSPLPAVGGASVLASHLVSSLAPPKGSGAQGLTRPTILFPPSSIALSGVAVLLIGFWFDGGLFKLPTCVVFWVLLELARGEVLTTKHTKSGLEDFWSYFRVVRVFRGSNESCPAFDSSRRRLQMGMRWLSGFMALLAIGLSALHLGTPQLAVSEWTLNIARKFIVPPKERADFEYLAAKNIWSNTPLKTLLQHAHLANYNRTLVNWKLEDQIYRDYVLSPEILVAADVSLLKQNAEEIRADSRRLLRNGKRESAPSTNHAWRRPLWEYFYPRIRKESSLEAAAEIVVRHLRDRVTISEGENLSVDIQSIWQRQITTAAGFERIYVAALRSAGIPSRLAISGQAEFWNGAEWKPAPRPLEGRVKVD